VDQATLQAKHAALSLVLTERSRRLWAATEAQAIGYGGIAQVVRATGIAASTIQRGLRDLARPATRSSPPGRASRAGVGSARSERCAPVLLIQSWWPMAGSHRTHPLMGQLARSVF
jgi:hypothetical protein